MRVSRRDFIKAVSLGVAASSIPLGAYVLKNKSDSGAVQELQAAPAFREFKTVCAICGQTCPIKIDVDGRGRIVRVRFNHPGYMIEHYARCGRPLLIREAWRMPQRIKKPLRRVGPRGSGEFEEISWEEALDIIASKLKEYSPDEVVIFADRGYEADLFRAFMSGIARVPNTTSHVDTCVGVMFFATWWLYGSQFGPPAWAPDYLNARLVVLMGRNPVDGIVAAPWTKNFSEGLRRGVKVIVFDVRESRLTSIADRHFIIPPGTDLAIALAILHTIIKEGLYDADYLRKYTNASMLIFKDTLEPVGLADHPTWKDKKTYRVLDDADKTVKLKTEAKSPALRAEVNIDGKIAVTALDLIWEAVKDYTPEWAEKITGVSASDIVWVARQLATVKPSFIDPGYRGARYYNESMLQRVMHLINTLIGMTGVKGGAAWARRPSIPPLFTVLGIKTKKGEGESIVDYWRKQGVFFINPGGYSTLAIKSILEEKPKKINMVIAYNQNLVAHIQGSKDVIEALKKVDFVVVFDVVFNETAMYADLILPLTFFFEQSTPSIMDVSKTMTGQISIVEKAVDPPEGVDARPGWWIIKELGKRLDPEQADKFEKLSDHESIWREQATRMGINYEELKAKGTIHLFREPLYSPLRGTFLPTTTGEIELVNVTGLARFKDYAWKEDLLNPLPVWIPPLWMAKTGGKLKDDEFIAVNTLLRMSATLSWTRFLTLANSSLEWAGYDGVLVHRSRAEKLGIKDGDLVEIEGLGGAHKAKARVTDMVHPYALVGATGFNIGYVPGESTIRYKDGRVEKVILFEKGRGLVMNTSMLISLYEAPLTKEVRAAQNDVLVKVRKVGR